MLRSVQLWLLTATLAVPGSCFAAQLQPVGYACTPEGCSSCNEGCQNGCNACSSYGNGNCNGNCNSCDNCYGDCNGRRCNLRSTWHDNAVNWTGPCGPIGRAARWGVPGARCLKHCCDTKAAPDSGWAPPARYPVNRMNTGFAAYSGHGGGGYTAAPMVYQPTDTTQLGYSYAHVPTWRRRPGMIPATPEPSMFHARCCPTPGYCGSCMSGGCMSYGGYGNCMGGQIINQPVSGGYCPACVSQSAPAFNNPPSSSEGVVRMNRPSQQVQPAVQMKAIPVSTNAAPQKHVIRQTSRSVSSRPTPTTRRSPQKVQTNRTQPQKERGWFGLPSLGEVQF